MNLRGEIFGRRKDGTEFPAEASISKFTVGHEIVLSVRLRDITERKRTEAQLQTRTRQQSAVALIGQRALQGGDLFGLMQWICALVAQTLHVEFVKVLELFPDNEVLLRARIGWEAGLVGSHMISGGRYTLTAYTLNSAQPTIVQGLLLAHRPSPLFPLFHPSPETGPGAPQNRQERLP